MYRIAAFLLSIITAISSCSATSIVVFITPDGIVVGSDTKTTPGVQAQKAFLIAHRFIIACYGLASTELSPKPGEPSKKVEFFKEILEAVKRKMTPDMAVSGVERIVENQVTTMKAIFVRVVELGITNHQNAPHGLISGYLIAGYENGIPLVYGVKAQVDWGSKTVSIESGVQQSPNPLGFSFRPYAFHRAIDQVLHRDGEAYAYAVSKSPTIIPLVVNGRAVTLEQAKAAVRVMIEVEVKFKPDVVGLPISVLVIPSETLPIQQPHH